MAVGRTVVTVVSIDSIIERISAVSWSEQEAARQASLIVDVLKDGAVSWDAGDEDWIQILDGRVVCCYVHVKRPFIMALDALWGRVREVVDPRVVHLVVDSWTESFFSADLLTLRRAFPGHVLPESLTHQNVDRFTAQELWFATD